MECELDQKPLQLQNHHLPVVFAGGPRSQRVIPVYSTTIYDFMGKVRELPEEMLQKLDEDLLQETWTLFFGVEGSGLRQLLGIARSKKWVWVWAGAKTRVIRWWPPLISH